MKKFFIIIIFLCLCYTAFFSFRILEKGSIALVEDLRTKRIVDIYFNKYNIIVQGVNPWWYDIYEMPSRMTLQHVYEIAVPELSELEQVRYKVQIPLIVIFAIQYETPGAMSILLTGEDGVRDYVQKIVQGALSGVFTTYLEPQYQRGLIDRDREIILKKINDGLREKLSLTGIELVSITPNGAMVIPDMKTFDEGIRRITELRDMERINANSLRSLEGKIERDKILNRQYYDKLNEMSKIIKQNPDILKYIYIDKLGDTVKVVPSSGDFDILGVFKDKKNEPASPLKGEIDNLR